MSDSINLERLRKEAKTVLKQCRSGDAAAVDRVRRQLQRLAALDTDQLAAQIKLADVHYALAREKGYANWGELKRRDAPLSRFLTAVRGGALKAAQREMEAFPDFAEESIHAASAVGDVDAVRYHIDLDPGLLNAEEEGWPPLLYACASPFHQVSERCAAGILECATLLLDRGVDPNAYRQSALYRASLAGNRSVALLLFQRGATPVGEMAPPRAKQAFWGIPADDAAMDEALRDLFKDPKLVDEMNRRMAAAVRARGGGWLKKELSQLSPRDFYEPVYPANQDYNVMIWEKLIERGVHPNWTDTSSDTPLHHLAASGGDAARCEFFLAHGADPNLPKADGKTPYLLAVRAGNRAVADVLRAHGARTGIARPADELIGACCRADSDAAWTVVRSNAGVLQTLRPEDQELLVKAAGRNRIAEVKLMAELGLDLGGFGESCATALHAAAWHGHPAMVQLLLSFHAPVNVRDTTYGTSPLAWAAHGSRNCRDADDDYCVIIEKLFDAGADYAASVNRWGVQPEEIAGNRVAAIIRSHGSGRK